MPNKFTIGNKVLIEKLDKRTPSYILELLRLDHPRTIVATFYDDKAQHTRYYLGINKRGDVDLDSIHFRASQLHLWVKGNVGRPKMTRNYIRHPHKPKPTETLCKTKGGIEHSSILPKGYKGLIGHFTQSQGISSLNHHIGGII